jgi:ABC-type transport system involved in multi-copper enzyme maturation permease subunit
MGLVLVAELLKQARLTPARWLVASVWAVSAMILIMQGVIQSTGQMALRDVLGWAGGLNAWTSFWGAVCVFVPPAIAAWGSGFEQSQDTWKTVLVRHGQRWPFVISKLVVAIGWVIVLGLGSAVIWLILAVVLGAVLGSAAPFVAPGSFTPPVRMLSATVQVVLLFPLIQFVALRSRGNGTLAATIVGITFPLACRMVAGTSRTFDRLTPVTANDALLHQLRNTTDDQAWLKAAVGDGWPLAGSVLVLLGWFVVPLALSLWSFERKDIVSEVA